MHKFYSGMQVVFHVKLKPTNQGNDVADPEREHEGAGGSRHGFGDEILSAAQEGGLGSTDRQPGRADMSEFERRFGGAERTRARGYAEEMAHRDALDRAELAETARRRVESAVGRTDAPDDVAAFRVGAKEIFGYRLPETEMTAMRERTEQSPSERLRLRAVTEARTSFLAGDRSAGWDALEGNLARSQGDGTPQTMWTDELRNVAVSVLDAEKQVGLINVTEQDESFDSAASFLRQVGSDRVNLLLDDITENSADTSTRARRFEELLTRVEVSMAAAVKNGTSPESRMKLRLAQHAIYLERSVTEETVAGQMRRQFEADGPDAPQRN